MLKSKWPLWTGVIGFVCASIGHTWFYVINTPEFAYKNRSTRNGFDWVDAPEPLALNLVFFIGWWLLLISLTAMSDSKRLRWVAILSTTSIAIALIIHLLNVPTSDFKVLLFWIGYGVLLIAAIASVITIIASWLKKRNKKLPTS
jgi:hypothetical protein